MKNPIKQKTTTGGNQGILPQLPTNNNKPQSDNAEITLARNFLNSVLFVGM